MTESPVQQSEQYLLAVRGGESPAEYRSSLASLAPDELATARATDEQRLAFWINCYNAITQRVIAENSTGYKSRRDFFKRPHETIAGQELSLDDIEHGILRRGQHPFGVGYLRRPSRLRDDFLLQQEPSALDTRIHFALNCGARSCPPVVVYNPSQLDPQLNAAVDRYLQAETKFDEQTETVTIPAVFDWFEGDFGGRPGVIQFLRSHGAIPKDFSPVIKYRGWDWESVPRNFH